MPFQVSRVQLLRLRATSESSLSLSRAESCAQSYFCCRHSPDDETLSLILVDCFYSRMMRTIGTASIFSLTRMSLLTKLSDSDYC